MVANGVEYEVDCIIFATGFEISTDFRRRIGFRRSPAATARSLFDYWADGFRTLHGFTSHGFPNWFYIGISQNGLSVNMTAMFDDQARHIAYIISEAQKRQALTVEPTVEAAGRLGGARSTAWRWTTAAFLEACTPGYYNNEGSERPARWPPRPTPPASTPSTR